MKASTRTAGITVARFARAAEITCARIYQRIRIGEIPSTVENGHITIPGSWVREQADILSRRAATLGCLADGD
jgi:hypothetical protein